MCVCVCVCVCNSLHCVGLILLEDDTDGAAALNHAGTVNLSHDGQEEPQVKSKHGKRGNKTKDKGKKGDAERDAEREAASSSERLCFFDIGGVLVPIQKSSVNFQLGLYPGGDLVCQLSKRPTVWLSLSFCQPVWLPVSLPACLAACLPGCLPACLPAWLAGWLAGWLSVCLSVCLCLSACLCHTGARVCCRRRAPRLHTDWRSLHHSPPSRHSAWRCHS